jgi:hypothetical protein
MTMRAPLFIAVSILHQKSERSCTCMVWLSILHFSEFFPLDFGTVPTVSLFVFFQIDIE